MPIYSQRPAFKFCCPSSTTTTIFIISECRLSDFRSPLTDLLYFHSSLVTKICACSGRRRPLGSRFPISLVCGHQQWERKIDFFWSQIPGTTSWVEWWTLSKNLGTCSYHVSCPSPTLHHTMSPTNCCCGSPVRLGLIPPTIPPGRISWGYPSYSSYSGFIFLLWWCRRPWPWPFIVKVSARSIMLEI